MNVSENQKMPQPHEPASILTVDDIPANIQVLAKILDQAGYRVSAASNGEQALAMISTVVPDLVLLDVMMPGLDGFEVCRRIKSSMQTRHIPIILLTARTATEDVVTGLKAGAVDYITKPFNKSELLARTLTHIKLKKARDKREALIAQLKDALARVRKLSGLLPICPTCKKVRSDKGYWQRVDEYVSNQCDAHFSHGICPECMLEHYADFIPPERYAEYQKLGAGKRKS